MPHATLSEQDVPSLHGEKLFVNDGLLRPDRVGELYQSSPNLPMDEIRKRYNEDGYVFLKGLLPKEDVLKAREEYFKMLSPSGVELSLSRASSMPTRTLLTFQVLVPAQQVAMDDLGQRLLTSLSTLRFRHIMQIGTRRPSVSTPC
jgi:hypothetical protein